MATGLTTQLDAVNTMLSAIGSAPVNSLETASADVSLAKNILDEVTRQVLLLGWAFNTEKDYVFMPDTSGRITVPDTILRLTYTRKSLTDIDPVQRGQELYDRRGRTFIFTAPVVAEVVLMLPWTSLPEAARGYIKYRAARVLVERAVGSDTLAGMAAREEAMALSDLKQYDGDTADYNIFSSWSVYSILDRND